MTDFNIIDYSKIVYIAAIACIILGGLMPAIIARSKEHSFFKFYIFGLFLYFPAMITSLAMKEKRVRDSALFQIFRVTIYILGSLIGTYYIIDSSVYWFDYAGLEINVSLGIFAVTIIYLAFMISSIVSVAFIYIIRFPISKLAERKANSPRKLQKTMPENDDMFAGMERKNTSLLDIFDKFLEILVSGFNLYSISDNQIKTRKYKQNIQNKYNTYSHCDGGNVRNLDSLPFAHTPAGKRILEEKCRNRNNAKFIILSNNKPCFSDSDIKRREVGFYYAQKDWAQRPVMVMGILDKNCKHASTRSDNERMAVIPPGFVEKECYDFLRNDYNETGSLYDRCHLIAFRFCGDESNELNMVTGTHQLNIIMRDHFESNSTEVVQAIQKGLHVLYRVTPFYNDKDLIQVDLIPRGLEIEAFSIEDNGKSVCKHEFIFNKQDGVDIHYFNGSSQRA
ncbi:MAG: DNA/RNA non-specific endonuclease [Lachnospiraceae bacterium]|nr:DNA/RNA non-specific endonuclease [Lachnospiraceae bacterium]